MKRLVCIMLALYGASIMAVKKPVRIDSLTGDVPYEYSIIHTTIIKDPMKADAKPIIQRAEVGRVRPGVVRPVPANIKLKVPEKEISLEIGNVTSSIAEIAGTINPKAGVAASAAHLIIDEGLKLASKELNKAYDIEPWNISLIEILPGRYYRINTATGEVAVTPAFKKDLKVFRKLVVQYVPVARKFNAALRKYTLAYNKAAGPLGIPQKKQKELSDMFNKTVAPLIKQKGRIESQLQQYPLHRITIMAVSSPEGQACEKAGYKGPWKLYLYYYIGAKQSNIFEVPFCAKSREEVQDFALALLPNRLIDLNFSPGGIKFMRTDKKNISFPTMGAVEMNYMSPESDFYSWYDDMLIDEKANTIESYMFPFDIYKVLAEREAELKVKTDAATKANFDKLKGAIEVMKAQSSKKALEESTTGEMAPAAVPSVEEEKPEVPSVEEEKPTEPKGKEEAVAGALEKAQELGLVEKAKELLPAKAQDVLKQIAS